MSRRRQLAAVAWLLALATLAVAGAARASVEISVSAEDGTVYVDARATEVFTTDLDEALRSGLPARVFLEFVLYERRAGLWDREVVRSEWTVSVVFDLLDEAYSVLDESGDLLLVTADLVDVEELVSGVELWPLCAVEDLDDRRTHYLGAQFSLEPLSVEEVRDLERWLRGNVRQGARLRDVPGQLVGVLRNRLGLGRQSERARTEDFVPSELPAPD